MKNEATPTNDVHALTLAEIQRLTARENADRDTVVRELADMWNSRAARMPEPEKLSDHDEAVRKRALTRLNGFSPAAWKLASDIPREQQLLIERDAIDLTLHSLAQDELAASAAETYEWQLQHGDKWNELCREILLAAARLQALEAKALRVRQSIGTTPATLPLAGFIGVGRSIVGAPWQNDPISRARNEALEARIVSAKDLKEASNV